MKGDFIAEVGLTEPAPFSVIVTFVALPPKTLPLKIKGVTLQLLPEVPAKVTVGGLTHCASAFSEIPQKRHTKYKALVILFLISSIKDSPFLWHHTLIVLIKVSF